MNKALQVGLVGAIAAGTMFAVAPAAEAKIKVNKSIKGVELLMTRAQVKGVLGNPRTTTTTHDDFGTAKTMRYRKLQVQLRGNQVVSIATQLPGQKTPQGIGVGSSKHQVRTKVPNVDCSSNAPLCTVGQLLPGKRVTTFRFVQRHVSEVDVGIVVD